MRCNRTVADQQWVRVPYGEPVSVAVTWDGKSYSFPVSAVVYPGEGIGTVQGQGFSVRGNTRRVELQHYVHALCVDCWDDLGMAAARLPFFAQRLNWWSDLDKEEGAEVQARFSEAQRSALVALAVYDLSGETPAVDDDGDGDADADR